MGRAFSEIAEPQKLEQTLLSIVKYESLDMHNRIMVYLLFYNYNYHLKDKENQLLNANALQEAAAGFPSPYSIRLQ